MTAAVPPLRLAVADPSAAATAWAADQGLTHHADLASLLVAERPDGVIVTSPNHCHVEGALACIRAGAAVLLEKPLATRLSDGERLCRAVQAGGARLLVGRHRAHSPLLAPRARSCNRAAWGRWRRSTAWRCSTSPMATLTKRPGADRPAAGRC